MTFLPQAGRVLLYREPGGPGIRVDSGIEEGSEVSVRYDPLLAKLIAGADTRNHAIRRAEAALRRFPILGLRTNLPFLARVLRHPRFLGEAIDTGFIEAERDELRRAPDSRLSAAAAIACATAGEDEHAARDAQTGHLDPWVSLEGWR